MNNKNKLHKLPHVVEIDLKTGEEKVLKYAYLTDAELDKFLEPMARLVLEAMRRDITEGKFNSDEVK
ncbi:MAG: hypothetical protein RR087_08740 [Oscillospiraceae bacterium]